ncbi:hypothetical protein DY000_02020848 [Brassica cretica]|uniref:Uncharacterized protein n=1 Tax=Brassica cretica TaxID=69181 RepID=A0ABQ7E4D3_BRACR|nr:hypothetical protein DY000_02020848 [Brassica cretica]
MGRKELKSIASNRARKRRLRGPGDRGAVPQIVEQLRRSRDLRFYILAPTVGKINEKHLCEETDLSFLSAIMDPNQTVGTTPSRVNDIDPIGSDSGTEATPTGLTGANDATRTTQTQ